MTAQRFFVKLVDVRAASGPASDPDDPRTEVWVAWDDVEMLAPSPGWVDDPTTTVCLRSGRTITVATLVDDLLASVRDARQLSYGLRRESSRGGSTACRHPHQDGHPEGFWTCRDCGTRLVVNDDGKTIDVPGDGA